MNHNNIPQCDSWYWFFMYIVCCEYRYIVYYIYKMMSVKIPQLICTLYMFFFLCISTLHFFASSFLFRSHGKLSSNIFLIHIDITFILNIFGIKFTIYTGKHYKFHIRYKQHFCYIPKYIYIIKPLCTTNILCITYNTQARERIWLERIIDPNQGKFWPRFLI